MAEATKPEGLSEHFKAIEEHLRKKYYGWPGAKQFEGTAGRLTRAFDEFCWPEEQINQEVKRALALQSQFVCETNETLVEGPIDVWTLCPHHLIPCHFVVYMGYVPGKMVLGLSKISRVATALSKRPIIQEMYTRDLADAFRDSLKPLGVGVVVIGQHGCMMCRGIKQRARVTTSALYGKLQDSPTYRSEFLSWVRSSNGGSNEH